MCVCVYPDKFQCETETQWSPKMHDNESNGNNVVVFFLYFYDFAELKSVLLFLLFFVFCKPYLSAAFSQVHTVLCINEEEKVTI